MPSSGTPQSGISPAPLLTIAIPTYNRAEFLREFLSLAGPQVAAAHAAHPGELELLISDNGSTDATPSVLDEGERSGIPMRRVRQPENIGSDRNFIFCFRHARGRYLWLCGDDDILRPGAVATVLDALRSASYDWVFLPPESFTTDWRRESAPDPYGRSSQIVRSAREMALRVNVMVTFITGIIVNRERLLALQSDPPESFEGTNLTQLSWTLPLLRGHRQSLVLWQRFVAGRRMNSGGYSVGEVFGEKFVKAAHRLLPDDPAIAQIFINIALRYWFPATLLELREAGAGDRFQLHEAEAALRRTFARNFRFWIFAWPVIRLPLPLARAWCRVGQLASRLVGLLQLPGDALEKLRYRLAPPPRGNERFRAKS